ncbi:hypothetical protein [Lentzea sp. NPDC004782]|uniref:hypothetical protein n=1 Tax=Lentzea sp. NPDC004782 TaxID=3154458 RepID=UPI0033AD42EF
MLHDTPADDYTAVLVNYTQADPAKTDDRGNLAVGFFSPLPTTYRSQEPYTLTCGDGRGRLVGLADIHAEYNGSNIDQDRALRFTAMVWKSTARIGVGLARGRNGGYLVIDFAPAGTVLGQFRANVRPPR